MRVVEVQYLKLLHLLANECHSLFVGFRDGGSFVGPELIGAESRNPHVPLPFWK